MTTSYKRTICPFVQLSKCPIIQDCRSRRHQQGTNHTTFFSLLISQTALLTVTAKDGAARIFLPPYAAVCSLRERWCVSLVIQIQARGVAPAWDLWRTLYRLGYSTAAKYDGMTTVVVVSNAWKGVLVTGSNPSRSNSKPEQAVARKSTKNRIISGSRETKETKLGWSSIKSYSPIKNSFVPTLLFRLFLVLGRTKFDVPANGKGPGLGQDVLLLQLLQAEAEEEDHPHREVRREQQGLLGEWNCKGR